MIEELQGNLSHASADTENPNKNDDNEELRSDLLQDVPDWLQEIKENLVRILSRINTLPVLLMNYQWSREQKWYRARVSTVFIVISRRTEFRYLLENKNYKGVLQKTDHYNLVRKFIPMTQAMKIPDAKAAVDKELEKLDTIPAWN